MAVRLKEVGDSESETTISEMEAKWCTLARSGSPIRLRSGSNFSINAFHGSCLDRVQVHEALPGSSFNSLLLNRFKFQPSYVLLDVVSGRYDEEPPRKKLKKSCVAGTHSFVLKHGSLLVMKGYTQQDWMHSVPKRLRADAILINLNFRHVVVDWF